MSQLDEYAKSRLREDELAEVEKIVGKQAAKNIGDMRQSEYEMKKQDGKEDQTHSAWDYVIKPIVVGLDFLYTVSTYGRGILVNKEFKPATGRDVVKKAAGVFGIDYEPSAETPPPIPKELQQEFLTGPWYKQAFPSFFLPSATWKHVGKRSLETAAELATDPLMIALGPAGAATKTIERIGEEALPAIKTIKTTPEKAQGVGESVAAGKPSPGELPLAGEPVPRKVWKSEVKEAPELDLLMARPGTEVVGKQVLPLNKIKHAHELDTPEGIASGERYTKIFADPEKAKQVPPPVVVQKADGGYEYAAGHGRDKGLKNNQYDDAEVIVIKEPTFEAEKQAVALREVEELKIPIRETEPALLEQGRANADNFLEGFSKRRIAGQLHLGHAGEAQKPGQLGLPGVAKPNVPMEKISTKTPVVKAAKLEGEQLRLALKTEIDLDKKIEGMRKHIEQATLNDDQTRAAAQHLLDTHAVNPWTIIAKPQMEIPEQARVVAENAVAQSVTHDLMKAWTAFKANPADDAARDKYIANLAFAADVMKKLRAGEAEMAAAMRHTKSGQDPLVQSFQDLFEHLPPDMTLEGSGWALERMTTAKQKADLVKGMVGMGKVHGSLTQVMLNAFISSTATPVWNYAAGVSLFGAKVFERWRMQGYADAGLAPHGAATMMWAFTKSYIDLMTASAKLAKGKPLSASEQATVGRLSEDMTKAKEVFTAPVHTEVGKLNMRRSISSEAYGVEDSWLSPAIDYAGHTINIPSFMVGASDAFLKFAVRQAAMEARALDQAHAIVVADMKAGKMLNKPDAAKRVQEIKDNLLKDPKTTFLDHPETGAMTPLSDTGYEMANLVSMMEKIKSGTRGADLERLVNHNILTRSIMPFFRVSYISGREALIRTPVLGRLAPSVQADLAAGGYRAAKANAQLTTGWALATVGASLYALGMLEGDGPTDPEANKMWRVDHMPGTIGLPGDREGRIPYQRLGPVGQVLRFFANGMEYISRLPQEQMSSELAAGLAAVFASLVTDNRLHEDINDFFTMLAHRDGPALDKFIKNWQTKIVPYRALIEQVNKQIAGEVQVEDSPFHIAKSAIPGWNGITYYNMMGQKDVVPNETAWDGVLNNLGFPNKMNVDERTQGILKTLDKSRVTFGAPTRTHEGVRMNEAEYNDFKRILGELRNNGESFVDSLENLTTSYEWERAKPGPRRSRQTLLSNVVGAWHAAAFAEFMEKTDDNGVRIHESFYNDYMRAKERKFELQEE